MSDIIDIDEKKFDSCKALTYFIQEYFNKNIPNDDVNESIIRDLIWKMKNLNPLEKAIIMANSWFNLLPLKIQESFPDLNINFDERTLVKSYKKKHYDIGIVTILKCELEAILSALGGGDINNEDLISDDFRYWFSEIKRYGKKSLSSVTTIVGEPLNLPCSIAVEHLLNDFDIDLLVLVGIAAGPKNKVKLGHVVCSERVFDYEHVRLEKKKLLGIPTLLEVKHPRPLYIDVSKKVRNAIQLFDENLMCSYFQELLNKTERRLLPLGLKENFKPKFHKGTIAAGEKLLADGSLLKYIKSTDQRIRAGDQEDSGFAQVARFKNIDWCIFRGICDYGDHSKNDNWHYISSLAAASTCVTFLKTIWREELKTG